MNFPIVNRQLLTLIPTEEFYVFYRTHTKDETPLSMDDLVDSPYQFLIPTLESDSETDNFLDTKKSMILNHTLESFFPDNFLVLKETLNLDTKTELFSDWFEIEITDEIIDLGEEFELDYEDSLEDEDSFEELSTPAPL